MFARQQQRRVVNIINTIRSTVMGACIPSPSANNAPALSVVLFGSLLDASVSSPGDIDIWLDGGAADDIDTAFAKLKRLGHIEGLPLDVVLPRRLAPWLRKACQFNAAQGLAVVGSVPPLSDFVDSDVAAIHQAAYQARAAAEARDVITRAEVLVLAGAPEAWTFVELAARLFLRSRATTPAEWRNVRRLSTSELVPQLADYGCIIAEPVRWQDPLLIDALRMLIASSDPADTYAGRVQHDAVRSVDSKRPGRSI